MRHFVIWYFQRENNMIYFVIGLGVGGMVMLCVSCFIDLPFYRAAKKHLALSAKMLDEQTELFRKLAEKK